MRVIIAAVRLDWEVGETTRIRTAPNRPPVHRTTDERIRATGLSFPPSALVSTIRSSYHLFDPHITHSTLRSSVRVGLVWLQSSTTIGNPTPGLLSTADRTGVPSHPPGKSCILWDRLTTFPGVAIRREMRTATADQRGRIVIPAEFREKHGDRYRIVELRDSIKLIPVDKDPVEGFQDAIGAAFTGKSIEEIRTAAHSDAVDQALNGVPETDE